MSTATDKNEFPAYQPASRNGNALPLVLSIIALALASFAMAWNFIKSDGLGTSLDAYDLSTPEKALVAELQMQDNGDIRAGIALQMKRDERERKEQLKSIEVEKTLDFDRSKKEEAPSEKGEPGGANDEDDSRRYEGFDPVCKIVLYSYTVNGKKRYNSRTFQKETKSGLWLRTFESKFSMPKKLRDEIRAWERNGSSGPGQIKESLGRKE